MNPDSEQQTQDLKWMQHALKLAQHAESCGEVPVGAVIVLNNEMIGEGWNQPITLSDPSAHAEMLALRSAGLHQRNYRLPNTTLYVTLEPCVMCLGAMIHARVKRLVFGTKDPKAGSVCSAFCLMEGDSFNHRIEWQMMPGMESACSNILKLFFLSKRQ